MTKETSLDDILNEPEAEVEASAETEATPEQNHAEEAEELSGKAAERKRLAEEEASNDVESPPRDEKGRFAPKGEKQPEEPPVEAPPASEDEQGHIPIAALKDERAKRQALENELNQMRQYFAQMQQAQQQPQPQPEQAPPDRWEDPEGYDQWLIAQVSRAAEERATQAATEAFAYQRIAADAAAFRSDKPDYEQVIQVFGQMAHVNPTLVQQMHASPNPAKFAYETAKLQVEIQQYGGIDGLIEARTQARLQEQQQQVAQTAERLPPSAPPTISNSRSVGARSGPGFTGPTPLSDLLA